MAGKFLPHRRSNQLPISQYEFKHSVLNHKTTKGTLLYIPILQHTHVYLNEWDLIVVV